MSNKQHPETIARPQVSPAPRKRALGPVTSRRAGYIVFASLVAPILLLVESIRTGSRQYRHWLLTAFVTMYGATIFIRYDPTGEGSDGVRHLLLVYEHYVGMSFGQFLEDCYYILTFQEASSRGIKDLYKHIISYISGGILGAPQTFFVFVAFIYGYFFVGCFLEFFRHIQWRKLNYVVFSFVALLFLVKNIEGINTVRTWTGLWILMYACLRYYDTKNSKYILLMLVPPLIHFGYFLMLLPALAVLIFGNQVKIYAAIFILSSFTTFINPGDIVDVVESTGERGEAAVSSYLVEERRTFQERAEWALNLEGRWYRDFRFLGVQKWALNVLIYTLLAAGVYFSLMSYRQRSLFSVGLMTLAFSNMTWFLFAVSARSWIIGCIFILASFVMARTDPETAPRLIRSVPAFYTWGLHLSLLLFVPFFLYNLSTIMDYISVFMFVAPFLVWFNPEINMSIKYVLQVLLGIR